jgi:drug/metabolite transporter (DMT)-like permease
MATAEKVIEAGLTTTVEPAHQDRPLLGIIVIVSGIFLLPAMDAIAKFLSGHLPVIELVWARYLFYALAMLPVALRRQPRTLLRPTRPGLQLLRGVIMAFSAWMFFAAVSRMPLADAMAVFFIYPFLILIGSAFLLGESVSYLRWLMVILGFVGAALVIRPAMGTMSPGVPYALASGFAYAGSMLVTRKLGAHDPAIVTSAISALLGAVAYSLVMPFVWVTPGWSDWPLMALMGIIAAIGHFMIVHAHRLAPASQLAPFGYIEIVSAIIIGLVIFGDIPAPIVWLGIALIIGSGIVAMRLRR